MALASRRLLIARDGGSFSLPIWITTADILARLAVGFTKAAGNPVLPKGAGGAWDDWGVREMSPVVDTNGILVTETDGIWAYYWGRPDGTTGTFKIGLAKSLDNGVTWTRYGGNPVISPVSGWYSNHIAQPAVVKRGDGSRVMLAVGTDGSSIERIGCLTSTDGLTWTDQGSKLTGAQFLDGATSLSEFGVPGLRHLSSGTWLCLLEGLTSGVTNGWKIYGATASDPTGTWTVLNSGQPLMGPTGAGWEAVGVANPHVIENEPGSYAMIYNGINTFWQIGFAYSSDLTTWTRYGSNPILTKGAGGAWDDQQVETDFFLKEPGSGHVRLYYQGYSAVDGSTQVGLATA